MKRSVSIGLTGLTALASAGNILISLPLGSDDGSDLLGILIAVGISLVLAAVLYPVLSRVFKIKGEETGRAGRALLSVFYVLTLCVLIGVCVGVLTEFSEYASKVVLPTVHIGAIFAVIAAAAGVTAFRGATALSKTASVLLILTAVLCVTVFIFSAPKMSLKYIIPNGLPDIGQSLITAIRVMAVSFFEVILPISVLGSSLKSTKSVLLGTAAGGGFILLCAMNALLVFGGGFASTLEYPYTSAVSTVNLGDIFSRMDGFVYVMIFFTCLIKTALLFCGIKTVGEKLARLKLCGAEPEKI